MDEVWKFFGIFACVGIAWTCLEIWGEEAEENRLARLLGLSESFWADTGKDHEGPLLWMAYRTEMVKLAEMPKRGFSQRTINLRRRQLEFARKLLWRRCQKYGRPA